LEFPYSVIVTTEQETAELAGEFAGIVKPGDIIALNGELGAGKTFFVKSLLKNFGIPYAGSPTFSIVNEYEGSLHINHFDFYRINKVEELYDIGFEEYLIRDNSATLIEWAGLLPEVLPSERIEISFEVNHDFSRSITFTRLQ